MLLLYSRIVGDEIVNISIDKMNSMRLLLEKKYDELENDINSLYLSKKDDVAKEKIEIQDLIDKQLSLLDTIIHNLESTPKLYSELMSINEKFKQIVGDYSD